MNNWLRIFLAAAASILLASCQTVSQGSGFSASQVSAMELAGFKAIGPNYELGIDGKVLFDFDSSELRPDMAAMLHRVGQTLVGVGIGGATVEGHADSIGKAAYNKQLSVDRAQAVKVELVRSGMENQKIRVIGMGENDPIESNATKRGRQQNRRVVIVITPADALQLIK